MICLDDPSAQDTLSLPLANSIPKPSRLSHKRLAQLLKWESDQFAAVRVKCLTHIDIKSKPVKAFIADEAKNLLIPSMSLKKQNRDKVKELQQNVSPLASWARVELMLLPFSVSKSFLVSNNIWGGLGNFGIFETVSQKLIWKIKWQTPFERVEVNGIYGAHVLCF